jgi:hypothetical protein
MSCLSSADRLLSDIDLERSAQCCFHVMSDKLLLVDALKNIRMYLESAIKLKNYRNRSSPNKILHHHIIPLHRLSVFHVQAHYC